MNRSTFQPVTPETRDAALEGLRFEVKALKPGQRVGYWKLMDQFDAGDSELSRLLDSELHKLEASGEIAFVQDDEGSDSIVERREASTPVRASKVPAKKKKAPAKAKKKPVKAKKR